MTSPLVLHPLAGPPGSPLEAALDRTADPRFRPLVGPFDRLVAAVSGAPETISTLIQGLPEGPGRPEAIAVRARRRGDLWEWGPPRVVPDTGEAIRVVATLGRSSAEMLRADPALVIELSPGGWHNRSWQVRALRRLTLGGGQAASRVIAVRSLRLALDVAFWSGVRSGSSVDEWRRLTRASYVGLVYHRLAGAGHPGQERVDIAPERFRRQMRALTVLGFPLMDVNGVLDFHSGRRTLLPRRAVAITVDDGFADNAAPLAEHLKRAGAGRAQLFVPTGEIGGDAHWLAGEPLLTWPQVRRLAHHGLAVGCHGRRHVRLTELAAVERRGELAAARDELRRRLPGATPILAYPNGAHDAGVRDDARRCGFRLAYTTRHGRNGLGTDPYCLRRISVHGADGIAAVVWKATTGEGLPAWWLRVRDLRARVAPGLRGAARPVKPLAAGSPPEAG